MLITAVMHQEFHCEISSQIAQHDLGYISLSSFVADFESVFS